MGVRGRVGTANTVAGDVWGAVRITVTTLRRRTRANAILVVYRGEWQEHGMTRGNPGVTPPTTS
jgi:hypothetical protein